MRLPGPTWWWVAGGSVAVLVVIGLFVVGGGDDEDLVRSTASSTTSSATTTSSTTSPVEAPAPSTTGAPPPPTTAAPTTAPPAAGLDRISVRLTDVATLTQPVAVATRPGDSGLYVAQQTGQVVRIAGGSSTTVLDLGGEVSTGGEQGLLGVVFSPVGDRMYVDFTDRGGDTRVWEYGFDGSVTGGHREVLAVDQPETNHNGGHLAFGPDGYLYVGLGDGGGGGDRHGTIGNGQDTDTLLGSILRIDPLRPSEGSGYGVPADNPFVGGGGAPELWSYGLRNPWRFSFDRATGDLWIGDVGQNDVEEVTSVAAATGAGRGTNFGWSCWEGNHPYRGCDAPGHQPPSYVYPNGGSRCAVTGGHVYRGSAIPAADGVYFFGDYCRGRVELLRVSNGTVEHRELGVGVDQLSSFGEDAAGELYVLDRTGPIYRIDPA